MATLMVLLVFALVVGRIAGAALRVTSRSQWHLRRGAERRGERLPPEPPPPELPPAAPTETPLERLQRQFAQGDISVEQYERELNRMYGIRG